MESGWIINFKNGDRVIMTEKVYAKHCIETPRSSVRSEEHWFSLNNAKRENPELEVKE